MFDGESYVIEELTEHSFDGVDIALFSAGGSISKKFGPIAASKGCFVVDNSSAFRMTDGIPLVIPEVNPEAMAEYKLGKKNGGIIANPNCSTIIALMAVTPIHRAVGVKRMIASTYQAASGAGALAMAELEQQTRDVLNGDPVTMNIFSWQYAFDPLLSSEEFGLGGAQYLRAYDPSEITGDQGIAIKLEIQKGIKTDWSVLKNYQAYLYYDQGTVMSKNSSAGKKVESSLSSSGMGVRANINDWLSGYFEVGLPVSDDVAAEGNKDPRFFFSINARY